jgi:hypothetical protein
MISMFSSASARRTAVGRLPHDETEEKHGSDGKPCPEMRLCEIGLARRRSGEVAGSEVPENRVESLLQLV